MSGEKLFSVEQLQKNHVKQGFSCGVEKLDAYFKDGALRDFNRHIAATFVLIERSSGVIIGFYTLSSSAINCGEMPDSLSTKLKLPKYPAYPATPLGRMAIDRRFHGNGYGSALLIDALRRAYGNRKTVGSLAVVVDAKDDNLVMFYERRGFIRFPTHAQKLFITMATIGQMLSDRGIPLE